MNNKEQKKEERHCDGCKIFATMGVHSFHCKIRDEKIVVSTIPTPPKALREEELREEFYKFYILNDSSKYPSMGEIADYWLSKLKQDRERIKERVLKGKMRTMIATYEDDRNGKYFHIDDILQILDEEQL